MFVVAIVVFLGLVFVRVCFVLLAKAPFGFVSCAFVALEPWTPDRFVSCCVVFTLLLNFKLCHRTLNLAIVGV